MAYYLGLTAQATTYRAYGAPAKNNCEVSGHHAYGAPADDHAVRFPAVPICVICGYFFW